MKCILGIGNPGSQYEQTRHNVGWMILDHLLAGAAPFQKSKWPLHLATWIHPRAGKVLVVKPTTYVNRSGQAAGAVAAYYRLDPSDLLVISDDINLPLGTLRLRGDGSHGGHNGLRDIIAQLGKGFPRLRFGIGAPPQADVQVDWVLGRFSQAEQADVALGLDKACRAIDCWLSDGLEAAMRLNGPLHPPPPQRKPTPPPSDDQQQ